MSQNARRFHTGRLLKICLAELVNAKALVVQTKGKQKKSE